MKKLILILFILAAFILLSSLFLFNNSKVDIELIPVEELITPSEETAAPEAIGQAPADEPDIPGEEQAGKPLEESTEPDSDFAPMQVQDEVTLDLGDDDGLMTVVG